VPHALIGPARIVLLTAVLALALGACGRRGPLEPPPDPSAPKTTAGQQPTQRQGNADVEDADDSLTPAPGLTPKKRGRSFTIPDKPFILDPLL